MELPIHLLSENFIKTKLITKETPFVTEEVRGRELLCPERIDLAAKIAYIEARETGGDMSFARELYRKHIEAFSEGYFTEPGDENKDSLEKFFSVFDELIDDFKKNGFNPEKSLIPVGQNNIILDGAHRTACAIYFDKTVTVIRFPQFVVKFDYSYFRGRRLSEEMLQYMAVKYSEYAQRNLYLACLWPVSAGSKRSRAVDVIAEKNAIILDSEIMLQKNGMRNFMLQIYQHQNWIGTPENHFSGVMGKVDACFAPGKTTQAILFEGGSLESVLAMKDEIRNIFQIDKHAIHISDSNEETRLMADLLFNDNSVHALNYGKPDAFPETYVRLKKRIEKPAAFNHWATIAYYGLADGKEICKESAEYDAGNPRTYFVFDGQKLPALSAAKVYVSKSENKELHSKIRNLVQSTGGDATLRRAIEDARTRIAWQTQKTVLRCKQVGMRITQKIGIYDFLHKILHR